MDKLLQHVGEKKACPYKDKCYRKNPVHFNEMSHPHLEKLIIKQLDETISIPDELEFECPDRSQLLDQLKVLQMVLRKERDKNGGNQPSQSGTSPTKKKSTSSPNAKEMNDLRAKIEKRRHAALQKREEKLKEMDSKSAKVEVKSEPETSNRKRILSSDSNDDKSSAKKRKSSESSLDSSLDSQTSSSHSSGSNPKSMNDSTSQSYIERLTGTNDRATRLKVRDQAIERMRQAGHKVNLVEPGEFALKFALSAPYHYFLTRVDKSKVTHEQQFTVSFPELLDISLGEIIDSLHINFMVEVGWLCLQYLLAAQNPKMTIICGQVCDDDTALPSNINLVKISMPTAYGVHHSKISVFKYKDDGIRIVVSTANIYSDDWDNRTQGLWMSPHLPQLPESANPSDGESPTKFKKSFRDYLAAYRHPKLIEWEHIIKRADFSAVNVFFVSSVPGSHKSFSLNSWGHRQLSIVLLQNAVLPPDAPQWPIIAQCSSIGSLGINYESWLLSNLVSTMTKEKSKGLKSNPNFQFVYPSLKNYEASYDCKAGSCCLPYTRKTHVKQEWLKNYLYQWKAEETGRTKAMPHIKSYTRLSPDQTQISWFVLTSANLSKGAWGITSKKGDSHYIMNYEAGVVFIPSFIINQNTFPIKESSSPDVPVFRLPYDLPLTKYYASDTPFVVDYLSD